MSKFDVFSNPLENEGIDVVDIELSSSNLSCTESVNLEFAKLSVDTECVISSSSLSEVPVIIESKDLSLNTRKLSTAHIKVICGSIGEDGDGIRSITAEDVEDGDGGVKVSILLSSGRVTTFILSNGHKGDPGDEGKPGKDADIEGANRAIKAANEAAKKASSAATQAENVDAILQDETLTITDRTGQSKSVNVIGPPGPPGPTTPTDLSRYTLGEYLALKEQGKLQNMFYSVYKGETLYRVYLGDTLVGKKAEDGERVTVGSAFPLVFPIIFS